MGGTPSWVMGCAMRSAWHRLSLACRQQLSVTHVSPMGGKAPKGGKLLVAKVTRMWTQDGPGTALLAAVPARRAHAQPSTLHADAHRCSELAAGAWMNMYLHTS